MTLYKWLDGSRSAHGGTGEWRKGKWRAVRGRLVPCENGLHLCREQDLLAWIAPSLWVVEHDGELVDAGNKVVVRRARVIECLAWDETAARLFAADCAERVLPIFERERSGDDRPRLAIKAVRAFARGEIGAAALAAAGDAAGVAAGVAAGAAAWDATRVAGAAAWDATRVACCDAARAAGAAAWDATRAARAAAGAAAWAAERKWQTARLLDYAYGRAL